MIVALLFLTAILAHRLTGIDTGLAAPSVPGPDIAVEVSTDASNCGTGSPIVFTVVPSNIRTDPITLQYFLIEFHGVINFGAPTCTAAGGASCAALSGYETTTDPVYEKPFTNPVVPFPAGSSLTYRASGTAQRTCCSGGSIAVRMLRVIGQDDVDTSNNQGATQFAIVVPTLTATATNTTPPTNVPSPTVAAPAPANATLTVTLDLRFAYTGTAAIPLFSNLTYSVLTRPANGKVQVNGNGQFTYTARNPYLPGNREPHLQDRHFRAHQRWHWRWRRGDTTRRERLRRRKFGCHPPNADPGRAARGPLGTAPTMANYDLVSSFRTA